MLAQLKNSENELNHIRSHYPAAGEYAGRLRSVLEELKDINGSAAAACERLDADPERLAKCSARLDTLIALQQKHRAADEAELIALRDRCAAQLAAIVHSDEEIAQAEAALSDEIDTGVSGRIADAMGEIIASLSASMQVVDITHLPQVASKGTAHFVVYKRGGRTDITRLGDEERVTEIAKMLSGSEITDAAVAQARILLGK